MAVVNTDRFSPVIEYIFDKLKENQVSLQLQDVYYGDQNMIPRTPAACVDPGNFTKELSGIGGKGRTDNSTTVYIMVYIARVSDMQAARKEINELSEKIMDVLHEDVTLGGLVVHGLVTSIEPGYATRGQVTMRAARITWQGLTRTLIT